MKYTGQKNIPGVIEKIVNEIPPFNFFHEPFAGSAAVSTFLSTQSSAKEVFCLNDIDEQVTGAFGYPAGAIVTNIQAEEYLSAMLGVPASRGDFVFVDPPYLHGTRPYATNLYNFELKAFDHFRLLSLIKQLKVHVMIIHPRHIMYDRMLEGWRQVDVTIRYHQKISNEVLYMNYPRPGILHTFGLVGNDRTDRQRIKRKGDRLLEKIKGLEVRERNYLLDRLYVAFPKSLQSDIDTLAGRL